MSADTIPALRRVCPAARGKNPNTSRALLGGLLAALLAAPVAAAPRTDPPCGDGEPDVLVVDGEHSVRWSAGGCAVRVQARPEVRFTAGEDDVAALSGRGYLRVESRAGARARQLEARAADGGAPVWQVDGQARPLDAEDRGLLHEVLPAFVRLTGINARERSRALLQARGPAAVLAEAGRVQGGREAYLALVLEGEPDAAALARVIELAGGVDDSREKGDLLLRAVRARAFGPALVRPLVLSAATIDPDAPMVDVLVAAAAEGPLSRAARDAYFAAVDEHVDRSSERSRALAAAVRGTADADLLQRVFRASERIDDGGVRAELLAGIAARHRLTGRARDAYLHAASGIDSTEQRERALAALRARGSR
jgi:hypothetical protein